jgi:hypothetical protein
MITMKIWLLKFLYEDKRKKEKRKKRKEFTINDIYIYIYIFLNVYTSFFQIHSFANVHFPCVRGLPSYAVQGFLDGQGFPAVKFIKVMF